MSTWDELLDKPYSEPSPPSADDEVDDWLGLKLPNLSALGNEIFRDLDPARHGVGWWDPGVEWHRRILIGDYLVALPDAIRKALREASLHLKEYSHWLTYESNRLLEYIKSGGQSAPPLRCRRDELSDLYSDMHRTGFFRALAAALDYSGQLAVGIVPLKLNLRTVDWASVATHLRKRAKSRANSDADAHVANCAKRLLELLQDSDPAGWSLWTVRMRNMLVHRVHRMGVRIVVARRSGGNTVPRVEHRLWRHPMLSDIETWIRYPNGPVEAYVNEAAELTMSGLLGTTSRMIDVACQVLCEHWQWRRENSTELVQFGTEQWPPTPDDMEVTFDGYNPSAEPIPVGRVIRNPKDVQRMRCAALDGAEILKWDRHLGRRVARPGLERE